MEAAEKVQSAEGFGRRRHPRKDFKREIGILYQGFYLIEYSTDLSESGISFISTREIPVGHQIVVTFQIPGGALISARAEIRGHFKTKDGQIRTGCSYKNIRFECKREIRNFVSARD